MSRLKMTITRGTDKGSNLADNVELILSETKRQMVENTELKKEVGGGIKNEKKVKAKTIKTLLNKYKKMSKNDSNIEKLQIIKSQIIFNFRNLILNEDIILLVGQTSKDGVLLTKEYSLTELVNSGTNSFYVAKGKNNFGSLNLIASLENLEKKGTNAFSNESRTKVWEKIYGAMEMTGNKDFTSKKGFDAKTQNSKGAEILLYRRNREDNNIYYSYNIYDEKEFNSQPNKVAGYYNINGEYKYFNRGWIFEWFMDKWYNNKFENTDIILSSEHPLSLVVEDMDNVKGVKGGDFVYEAERNYQIQAKYGNQQIMSRTSIDETFAKIEKILNLIENNDYEEAFKNVLVDFTTQEKVENGLKNMIQENLTELSSLLFSTKS